jgi:hypothetical protein
MTSSRDAGYPALLYDLQALMAVIVRASDALADGEIGLAGELVSETEIALTEILTLQTQP